MAKTKKMTPLKAIKLKCLECSCDSVNEVRLCVCKDCPLYPFRKGKNSIRSKEMKDNPSLYSRGFLTKKQPPTTKST